MNSSPTRKLPIIGMQAETLSPNDIVGVGANESGRKIDQKKPDPLDSDPDRAH